MTPQWYSPSSDLPTAMQRTMQDGPACRWIGREQALAGLLGLLGCVNRTSRTASLPISSFWPQWPNVPHPAGRRKRALNGSRKRSPWARAATSPVPGPSPGLLRIPRSTAGAPAFTSGSYPSFRRRVPRLATSGAHQPGRLLLSLDKAATTADPQLFLTLDLTTDFVSLARRP